MAFYKVFPLDEQIDSARLHSIKHEQDMLLKQFEQLTDEAVFIIGRLNSNKKLAKRVENEQRDNIDKRIFEPTKETL